MPILSPLSRSVKWGRFTALGVFSILIIALGFLWFAYKKDAASITGFYYEARYAINLSDGGVLSGVPCAAPCIFGIQTGKTAFDQVLPTLEENGIARSKCFTEPNVSWFLFSCGTGQLYIQVNTQTNLVNAITLLLNDPISLGEIIEKYGEPNFITLDQETLETLRLRLYWNSLRMLVTLPKVSSKMYAVENNTRVEAVDFSDESLYRMAEKETNPYYKPWKGYGTYQVPSEMIPLTPMPTLTMTR